MSRKFFGLIVLSFVLLCTPVITAAVSYETNLKSWETRKAFIERGMIEAGREGQEAVEEFLQSQGFRKLNSDELTTPLSISLDAYFDSIAKKYILRGYWKWSGLKYIDYHPGPFDAVSLEMYYIDWSGGVKQYRPVVGYKWSSNPFGIAVYDTEGNYQYHVGAPGELSASGVIYSFQDGWLNPEHSNYRGYSGQVWAWMDIPPAHSTVYLKGEMIHTYNAGAISSMAIDWSVTSPPSLNLTYSTPPSSWKATSEITISSWPHK